MTHRPYFECIAHIGKALSNPERVRLLELLGQGERSVERLADAAGQPLKLVSHHLQLLKRARLVVTRRQGRQVFYRLADDEVGKLWLHLRGFAEEHLDELKIFARQRQERRPAGASVGLDEVETLLSAEDVLVVDVRPIEEFRAGHLTGAMAIPLEELPCRVPDLRRARSVVVYCRGRHCSLADEAVTLLRAEGVVARRLELGVMELRAAAYPLQSSPASC